MATGPNHDYGHYARSIAFFLAVQIAAHLFYGSLDSWWVIVSTCAFGLYLGMAVGEAEYYTDGYEIMTLICPCFVALVGLVVGSLAAVSLSLLAGENGPVIATDTDL